jgi:hypothetical protein
VNSSTRIRTYLVLDIALGQYLHKGLYTWQYSDDFIFLFIVKLPSHLEPPTTWSRKFWYPSLVGSFTISQQVFWYPNAMRTIIRWINHLYSASVIFGSQVRYISLDNLMNERLSFRTILTKMTFVTTSVASLMLDFTCFVLRFPFGTFILAHVLVKCHFKAFVLSFLLMCLILITLFLDCLMVLSTVLEFFAETGYSGLPNRTIRFWQTCFDTSSFGQSAILWPFSLQPKHLL